MWHRAVPRSVSRDGRRGPGTPSASDVPGQQQQQRIKGRAKSNNPNFQAGGGCSQGGSVTYVLQQTSAKETDTSISALHFERENGSACNLTAAGASGAEAQQGGVSVMQQVRCLDMLLRFYCEVLPLYLCKQTFAGFSACFFFAYGNCSDVCPAATAPRAAAASQTEAEASLPNICS